MVLISVAEGVVGAAVAGIDDVALGEAKVLVGRAGGHIVRAARRVRPGLQRLDGTLSVVGGVVHFIPVSVAVGVVAYLCRGPLGLAAGWTALVVVVASGAVSGLSVPLLRACRARYGLRGFVADWSSSQAGIRRGSSVDVTAGLDAIMRARAGIGALAAARLAPIGRATLTGAGMLAAAKGDAVVWHLRAADVALCQGYDAMARSRPRGHA